MPADRSLIDYYSARASEYEQIYDRPERQSDLGLLREAVASFASGRRVVEIACGTGYWTVQLAQTASDVVATDLSAAVLDVARAKDLGGRVRLKTADAFELSRLAERFEGAFAGFWWSHIRNDQLPAFLDSVRSVLIEGSPILVIDNRYVKGNSTPISRRDAGGNTYQRRKLANGESYEILKNYPDRSELDSILQSCGARLVEYHELAYYWYGLIRA